jgi:hypothetical protein
MASTELVKDVLWRVSDQLQDTNAQFTRWSQRTLVNYLNDAQRVLSKYLPHSCSRVDAIKLSPGTKQSIAFVEADHIVPGDGSTPADTIGNRLIGLGVPRNMGTAGVAPGRAIRPVDRATLDVADPLWHTRTGPYVTSFVYDPNTPKVFYVSPGVPATPPVWVEVSWVPDPYVIPVGNTGQEYAGSGSSNVKLSVDDRNVDDIVNYMLARAEMRDAEFAEQQGVAGFYASAFVSSINVQAVAAGLPNPRLRSLPVPGTNTQEG